MTTRIDIPEKTIRKQARAYLLAFLIAVMLWAAILAELWFMIDAAIRELV